MDLYSNYSIDQDIATLDAGGGVRLEMIDDRHADETFSMIRSNKEHLGEWLPWVNKMQTTADFRVYIRQCKQQHQAGTDCGYMIYWNDHLAGRIGLHYIHRHNRSGAIGYWLGKEFEGKGIVTRSCASMLHLGFTRLGLNRIEIKCGVGNLKSAAIPERLGFSKEGVLRQAEWVNGGFLDLSLYSLLKEEWQAQH